MLNKVKIPTLTFWRLVLVALLGAGLYSTYVRFIYGLGASTALSDHFPWGIWIGFDVLCGVALAAGGFTISAVVYVFHIDKYKPIIRPTILTAFLGYSLVIVALMFDLGRPYRIWHAMVMWNPHSVMFEVAWCVMLYTTVLALEFSPIVFEKLKWHGPLNIVHKFTVPLVILGVLLSMLHQSSLGSLFLIVPEKQYPLWYSPLLPILFFVSAVGLGLAMTIFESFLSFRVFRRRLEMDLLSGLGKALVVTEAVYLMIKYVDLSYRGQLYLAFQPTYEGRLFLLEVLMGGVIPIILLLIPKVRSDQFGLFVAAVMVVFGTVMNRLNIATTGLEGHSGRYFPSWTELSVTAMIIAVGFVLFGLAVKYLPVFVDHEDEGEAAPEPATELPAVAFMSDPLRHSRVPVLVVGGLFLIGAVGLGYSGLHNHNNATPPKANTQEAPPDISGALEHLSLPAAIVFDKSKDSPGPVTFNHESHVNYDRPNCGRCHLQPFPILETPQGAVAIAQKTDMHGEGACGKCHNGKEAFSTQEDCESCHQSSQ